MEGEPIIVCDQRPVLSEAVAMREYMANRHVGWVVNSPLMSREKCWQRTVLASCEYDDARDEWLITSVEC